MLRWYIFSLLFYIPTVYGQATMFILDPDNFLLGKIENGHVYTGPDQVAYTISGNQIFLGEGTQADSLLLRVDCKDVFSRKAGLVYNGVGKEIRFITRKGGFFLGDHPIDEVNERLLDIHLNEDSTFLVTHGLNGDTLAIMKHSDCESIDYIAALYLIVGYYGLQEDIQIRLKQLADANTTSKASMSLLYPMGDQFIWLWDGENLQKTLYGRVIAEWLFDGKQIKPVIQRALHTSWIWDGSILKPEWNADPTREWVWNDSILKPYWNSDPDQMWQYSEGIMRPMWDTNPQRQWQVDGSFPLPLIALIALGIVY